MTSLSRYLEEAAFSISISVFIFLRLFSRCIMGIVFSIVFISCPSLRTCSENLDFPSAYLKSFLCYFIVKNQEGEIVMDFYLHSCTGGKAVTSQPCN